MEFADYIPNLSKPFDRIDCLVGFAAAAACGFSISISIEGGNTIVLHVADESQIRF